MIRSIQLRHTNLRTFNYMYTTPSAVCLCDNIGLVSLIILGWELHVSYITVLCVQGIPILSPSLFMPSLYSTLIYLYIVQLPNEEGDMHII